MIPVVTQELTIPPLASIEDGARWKLLTVLGGIEVSTVELPKMWQDNYETRVFPFIPSDEEMDPLWLELCHEDAVLVCFTQEQATRGHHNVVSEMTPIVTAFLLIRDLLGIDVSGNRC